MRWRVKEDKDRRQKEEREETHRPAKRCGEHQEALKSEKRKKRRGAESSEGCGERQEAQRTAKKRREKKRRDAKNSEKGHGISKKLRRSRRKVEKLEITLLSLNAGRKSQARKRGEDTRQRSWAYTPCKHEKNKLVKICEGFSRIDFFSKMECTGRTRLMRKGI